MAESECSNFPSKRQVYKNSCFKVVFPLGSGILISRIHITILTGWV